MRVIYKNYNEAQLEDGTKWEDVEAAQKITPDDIQ